MNKAQIVVCRDPDELARRAAEQFVACSSQAIARSGRFAVALSGGATPKMLYALLAAPGFRERIDWACVHLFWSDERCVPPDHPDSNFRMVQEALLSRAPIPTDHFHRMPGEREPRDAAVAYETELREFFDCGTKPLSFDLMLLGLGEDGHTASLFPGTAVVDESEHLVAAVYVESLKTHRLTLTLPVINAAGFVMFLASGKSKAKVVREILSDGSRAANYPAAKVRPAAGRLTWMLDAEAARDLPPEMI
jgi:6-phosphogluconolactonase